MCMCVSFLPLAEVSGRLAWQAWEELLCSNYSIWGRQQHIYINSINAAKTLFFLLVRDVGGVLLGADFYDQVGVIDDGRVLWELLVGDDLLVKLLCKDTHPYFLFSVLSPQFTHQRMTLCQSDDLTFSDLPVVVQSSTQRDGNGRQVRHGVTVAVHSAVSSRADRLRGQAGAVEAGVGDAPHCCTTVATEGRKRVYQDEIETHE